jgi:diguanylate cyclase (GGDEF)-like protein
VWESRHTYPVVYPGAVPWKIRQPDFEALVEILDDGVLIMRNDGFIKYINPAAMRIYGIGSRREATEFFRKLATMPCYYGDGTRVPPALHRAAMTFRRGAFSKEIYGIDLPSDERRWLLTSGRLLNPDDPLSDLVLSISDITAQRRDLDRLIHQANHDPLTGLPNRAVVLRRITEALASSGPRRLRAVLFIDLDDLKTTNDTLGHDAGDELLRAAATRLRQSVGRGDVVARLGGDEFVILMHGDLTDRELNVWLRRLRGRLWEPANIVGVSMPIRASVGIVEVQDGEQRAAEEILHDADSAMYRAKRIGRGIAR